MMDTGTSANSTTGNIFVATSRSSTNSTDWEELGDFGVAHEGLSWLLDTIRPKKDYFELIEEMKQFRWNILGIEQSRKDPKIQHNDPRRDVFRFYQHFNARSRE